MEGKRNYRLKGRRKIGKKGVKCSIIEGEIRGKRLGTGAWKEIRR